MEDGLLAVGGELDIETLLAAYGQGLFPWYNREHPVLWWSPNPRTVLRPSAFKIHSSLRKTLRRVLQDSAYAVRINHDFAATIAACAEQKRIGQDGTWIHLEMQSAYMDLHRIGHAFSVELWHETNLIGGLYGVLLGQAVFGESMFSRVRDASKIALTALVDLCAQAHIEWIDCQQDTPHLRRLGAQTISRDDFLESLQKKIHLPAPPALLQTGQWLGFKGLGVTA